MFDWKTLLDDPTGPWLLRLLARIARPVTWLLIIFSLLSLLFNILYYLGDVSRDSLTTRLALADTAPPHSPIGLVASAPAIMNNRSKGYDLLLANDPPTMAADQLVVTVIGVSAASLLPAATSVFTFTSSAYQAIGLELRNEPTPLRQGLTQWWPTDASAAVVNLRVEQPGTPPQITMLQLRVPREPATWGLLRQIFVIDSFNTAALGIGLVLVLLQRLTSARQNMLARNADEALGTLRERYRSGQHPFEEVGEQIRAYERRYRSVLKRDKGLQANLSALASSEIKLHKRALERAADALHQAEGNASANDTLTASSRATAYLDEHAAWFLHYCSSNDAKSEILETLDRMRHRIKDPALRQGIIRQVRLYQSRGTAPYETLSGSDPEFPQLPASLLEHFAKEQQGDGTLIIIGPEGSGKSCLLDFIRGQLERQFETRDGYALSLQIDAGPWDAADDTVSEATVTQQVAAEMLRQLRRLFNRHPDLMSDLLDEREQARLLYYTFELNQKPRETSPDGQQHLALIGRVFEQLAYQHLIVLVDNAPPSLDISKLAFILRVGLPPKLARGTRVCCTYEAEPAWLTTQESPRPVRLEWLEQDGPSDDRGSRLGKVLHSAFFSRKAGAPHQKPGVGSNAATYGMVERLDSLQSTERKQAAEKAILLSSRTPADLVVWRQVFEEYFVEWETRPTIEHWDRLYSAMQAERARRETGPRWALADWEQAKLTLRPSASGALRPKGTAHDD